MPNPQKHRIAKGKEIANLTVLFPAILLFKEQQHYTKAHFVKGYLTFLANSKQIY
jgi:hypothetical protein